MYADDNGSRSTVYFQTPDGAFVPMNAGEVLSTEIICDEEEAPFESHFNVNDSFDVEVELDPETANAFSELFTAMLGLVNAAIDAVKALIKDVLILNERQNYAVPLRSLFHSFKACRFSFFRRFYTSATGG